jgi:hypothetical protein
MIDQNLKRRMELMSPRDLKQFALLHKNDPFVVSMAVDIDNTRKAAQRQQAMQMASASQGQPPVVDQNIAAIGMPEGGIPVLPAQNMEGMADGGIVGYATGGKTADQDKETYREYAMRKAREYGLDPKFVNQIFEIESGYDPKAKSGTGPQGIGQLTSYIAKRFGISPKDRTDPYKNMDASIGFMDYLNKKYKGDPAKIAVAYNQGEPVLDAHLKRNKGKLVPETLHEDVKTENKQEPAKYLEKMAPVLAQAPAAPREVPRTPEMLARQQEAVRRRKLAEAIPFIGAAQAAEPQMSVAPTQPPTPADRFSDISVPTPASMAAERKRAEAARNAPSSFYDKLYGAAEAAHATLLGAPATATGLIALDPVARYLAPKTEKGKEYTQDIHDLLVGQMKLPPYIAGVGVPRAPTRAPAAREAAGIAELTAKAARERAETAKAPRLPAPKAEKPMTPLMEEIQAGRAADAARKEFSVAPETAEVAGEALARRKLGEQASDVARAEKVARTAEAEAALAGDKAEAARLADRLGAERQGRLAGIEQLTSVPGLAGEAAGVVPPAPTKRPYEAWEADFVDRDRTPSAPTPLEEETKVEPPAPTPAKTGLGALTDEDWLTMGLHMLQAPAGQPGGALSQLAANVGRSGLATLGEKRAREQRELDRMYRQTMEGYYKGLTGQLGKEPEEIRTLRTLQGDPKLMDAYRQMQEARDITGQRARLIQQFYSAQMMGQLPADMTLDQWLAKVGGDVASGGADMFKVVGSRPSP